MLEGVRHREELSKMKYEQDLPWDVCFGAVSKLVLARLMESKNSLRVEIALRTMLSVLPNLEAGAANRIVMERRIPSNTSHPASQVPTTAPVFSM